MTEIVLLAPGMGHLGGCADALKRGWSPEPPAPRCGAGQPGRRVEL